MPRGRFDITAATGILSRLDIDFLASELSPSTANLSINRSPAADIRSAIKDLVIEEYEFYNPKLPT